MKRCACLLPASGARFSCVAFVCVSEHNAMVQQATPYQCTSGMLTILNLSCDNVRKKRKECVVPFGVNSMRSQVLYWAAQMLD